MAFKWPHIAWDKKAQQNIGNLATIAQKIGDNPILTAAIGIIPGGVTVLKGLNMAGKVAQDTGLIGKGTWVHNDPLVGLIDTSAAISKAMGVKGPTGEAGMGPTLNMLQGVLKTAAPIATQLAGSSPLAAIPMTASALGADKSTMQLISQGMPIFSAIQNAQQSIFDSNVDTDMKALKEKMKEIDALHAQYRKSTKSGDQGDPEMEKRLKEAKDQVELEMRELRNRKKTREPESRVIAKNAPVPEQPIRAQELQQSIDDEMTKRTFMPGRRHQSVVPQINEMREIASDMTAGISEDDLLALITQLLELNDREIPIG